ncbi:DUF6702 family protein [Raineya orbicola]|jgi:hypothetical protein|uniref:Uncharacterized protein n=1 Tax=Raineya orbicola TaxID=2016530 RepID=A0A2N3ICD2_9BACT|nr:DUF6702 family protein [Raineya orbicola]PKQ68014.1 hypothetical protein Rain11_1825 [Raineya orbicola]
MLYQWLLWLSLNLNIWHDFHSSFAEMYYNPQEKAFQVSLKFFADDLENALTKFSGKKYFLGGLGKDRSPDEVLVKYLEQKFRLVHKSKKKVIPIRYIGKEIGVESVTAYFEMPFTDKLSHYELHNTIMLELFDDQINIVLLQKENQRKSFEFNKQKTNTLLKF